MADTSLLNCQACKGETLSVGTHKLAPVSDNIERGLFICPKIENPMAVVVLVRGPEASMIPCLFGELRLLEADLKTGETVLVAVQDCPYEGR